MKKLSSSWPENAFTFRLVSLCLMLMLLAGLITPVQAALPPVTFGPATNYTAGASPFWITSVDLNSDGKLDLVISNVGSNNISVLLGKGDGTFQAAVNYAVGNSPYSVKAADFNGDGKLDLVVSNVGDNNVSFLAGKGDGTFNTAVNFPAGQGPTTVSVVDLNGDNKLDLVTTNLFVKTITVLLGNGNGTFQAPTSFTAGSGIYAAAIADFNGDGKLDVVTTNYDSNDVSFLAGNGDGTFKAPVNYPAGFNPFFVERGDFNGDGKLDLAVANYNGNDVSILLGKGDGSFQAPVNYVVGNTPTAIAAADLNGDGTLDLVTSNVYSDNVSVLLGNGDGTFEKAFNLTTATGPNFVAIGDYNGDGKPDISTANLGNSASVILNTTTFPPPTVTCTHPSLSQLSDYRALGDNLGSSDSGNGLANLLDVSPPNDGTADGTYWRWTNYPKAVALQVDLQSVQTVSAIKLFTQTPTKAPNTYFQFSQDGKSWSDIPGLNGIDTGANYGLKSYAVPNLAARYLRLVIDNTTYLYDLGYFSDLQICAQPGGTPTGPQTPVSHRLPISAATASAGAATNILDGIPWTNWLVDNRPNTAELKLDLGTSRTITSLRYFATYSAVALHTTIEYSADGTSWAALPGASDINTGGYGPTPAYGINTLGPFSPVQARYLRFRIDNPEGNWAIGGYGEIDVLGY